MISDYRLTDLLTDKFVHRNSVRCLKILNGLIKYSIIVVFQSSLSDKVCSVENARQFAGV